MLHQELVYIFIVQSCASLDSGVGEPAGVVGGEGAGVPSPEPPPPPRGSRDEGPKMGADGGRVK